jgi:nucleoporin POM152
VAKDEQVAFPIRLRTVARQEPLGLPHTVEYLFTPEDSLLENGEHNPQTQKLLTAEIKTPGRNPEISRNGLYTLKSVKAGWCEGDIAEPSSCMLEQAPTPEVSINSVDVTDKCDRMPVGLRVDLDFVGTPPFHLDYVIDKKGSKSQVVRGAFNSRREHIELKPKEAGHYTYRFTHVADKFYKPQQISANLEVDVKPSSHATFSDWSRRSVKRLCLGDAAEFKVEFIGESPWSLEYELVHGGKRTKSKIGDILESEYTIRTPQLHNGGEYTISLVRVSDPRNCPESLTEDLKFNVQLQRPKAAFGLVDGKRSIQAVEGTRQTIPLKLTGERPWLVEVRKIGDTSPSLSNHFDSPNSELRIDRAGTYEIVSVHDSVCNGQVEDGANKFTVSWIDRPQLRISDSPTVDKIGANYRKSEVCEGDEDYLDIAFSGKFPIFTEILIICPLTLCQELRFLRSTTKWTRSRITARSTGERNSFLRRWVLRPFSSTPAALANTSTSSSSSKTSTIFRTRSS